MQSKRIIMFILTIELIKKVPYLNIHPHICQQQKLRQVCAVSPEPSLFTHTIYGAKESFSQGAGVVVV